jgi:hypothetical protein
MKIRTVGAQLFRAEGKTDTTMLKDALKTFANAHKKRVTNTDPTYLLT